MAGREWVAEVRGLPCPSLIRACCRGCEACEFVSGYPICGHIANGVDPNVPLVLCPFHGSGELDGVYRLIGTVRFCSVGCRIQKKSVYQEGDPFPAAYGRADGARHGTRLSARTWNDAWKGPLLAGGVVGHCNPAAVSSGAVGKEHLHGRDGGYIRGIAVRSGKGVRRYGEHALEGVFSSLDIGRVRGRGMAFG